MRLPLVLLAISCALLGAQSVLPARAEDPSGLDWSLDAGSIATRCDTDIAQLRAKTAAIARARGPRTFANTILLLERAGAAAYDDLASALFLKDVSSDKAVRDASRACAVAFSNASDAVDARPDLYAAVAAAARSGTARTVYDRKLAALWVERLRRTGAALTPAKRAEYLRLSQELTQLEDSFERNLSEDQTTIAVGRRDLGGLPQDFLAASTRNRDGSYTVAVNESTLAFLQYSTSEAARKAYYLAYNQRAATANVPLFERALAVRDRMAHLLGYESWADYRLADKMAGSLARVEKFLQTVASALQPAAQAQIAAMQAAVDAENGTPGAALQPWDVRRGEYLVKKARSVDETAIRQYFPVQHTIDAVLAIYHTLLGVDFTPVVPAEAWAPGVLEYRVSDTASGKPIGTTYFDLYPRPGKFKHFANFPILPVRGSGAARLPVSAIVGNWPQPAPGQPALLTHGDVVTFFHEFGHDMAALLATAPYETLTDGFRDDFVEAPSQMLENFVWQPEIIKSLSSQWKFGEPLSDDAIAVLAASRDATDAYETLRLLTMATIDMQYHSMGPHVDSTAVWAQTAGSMLPLLYYPGTYPQVAFDHLMGGYDAGLYAYPWAKVYAQDLFTAFAGANLLNPETGMRYRKDILAPARTYEPDAEVRAFLGRPMNPNAFYAEFGIAPPAVGP